MTNAAGESQSEGDANLSETQFDQVISTLVEAMFEVRRCSHILESVRDQFIAFEIAANRVEEVLAD